MTKFNLEVTITSDGRFRHLNFVNPSSFEFRISRLYSRRRSLCGAFRNLQDQLVDRLSQRLDLLTHLRQL